MTIDLGPHAVFIWLCYGAVALVVMALTGWLLLEGRRRERELASLEAQGIGRGLRDRPGNPPEAS